MWMGTIRTSVRDQIFEVQMLATIVGKKVATRRKVAEAIKSLVNAKDLQLEALLIPVLLYGSEAMVWRKEESSRTKAVQMDSLRGPLGIRRMDKLPNAQIKVALRGRTD